MRLNITKFVRDERGAIALLFGFCATVVVLAVGLAIDGARTYSTANRVGAALDAAALAGAKLLNETDISDDDVEAASLATLDVHLTAMRIGGVIVANRKAKPNRGDSSVTVSADIGVRTLFGSIAGIANIDFKKSATTIYDAKQVEVVLALDITGSMDQIPAGESTTKLVTLKSVASTLVSSVFDLAKSDMDIRIGVVPWSAAVNGGAYAKDVKGTSSGDNCVAERAGSGKTTDEAPGPLNYSGEFVSPGTGYTCPSEPVMPMLGKSHRDDVLGKINGFTAFGGTAGHLGAAWAWYMISPNWASYFHKDSKPGPYSPSTIKNVIIMTDGTFNTSYVNGAPTAATIYDETSYTLFQQNCAGMRAKGITVYTVGFALPDARTLTELQTCAGGPANFFNATTASQLQTAFATITSRLNSIRISN
jgi:Flp pilus assembly protein TadG